MSDTVRRRPDGSVILPPAREPSCEHPGGEHQPASACTTCRHSQRLLDWKRQWGAYFLEHPDDPRNPEAIDPFASGV
jgi:hypothetical protein